MILDGPDAELVALYKAEGPDRFITAMAAELQYGSLVGRVPWVVALTLLKTGCALGAAGYDIMADVRAERKRGEN